MSAANAHSACASARPSRARAPRALAKAVGLAASFGLARVLAALLVGVTPADPLTFLTVALVLTLAAVVGTAIPAHRAMQVDPIVALRHQ